MSRLLIDPPRRRLPLLTTFERRLLLDTNLLVGYLDKRYPHFADA